MSEEPEYDWEPSIYVSECLSDAFEGAHYQAWYCREDVIKKIQAAIGALTESLEGLSSTGIKNKYERWQKIKSIFDWAVDWWYCKDAVKRIPGIRDRFLKLTPMLVGKTPEQEVNSYLKEATRCYLYGFFQASVALSRAALETGLNHHLGRHLGATPQVKLSKKIDQAARWKLIRPEMAYFAHEVNDAGNKVLHEKPVSEARAFDTLIQTRKVLVEIYQR